MCKYCEETLDEGFDEFGLPFKKYTFHPYNNSFLILYRNDWVLCDEDGEYLAIIEYCPWCGRALDDSKEEISDYGYIFSNNPNPIEACTDNMTLIEGWETPEGIKKEIDVLVNSVQEQYCHVYKIFPHKTFKRISKWEENQS